MYNYTIIDLSLIQNKNLRLVNQAYQLWETTYSSILSQASEQLDPMCFWRSKILTTITTDNEIIGLHLYNMFNLQLPFTRNHTYFADLSEEQYHNLCQMPGSRFISGEFLTVANQFRGKSQGFLWSEVIVGLSSLIFLASDCDHIIGISRVDKRVDQMTQTLGGSARSEIIKHNIHCKVMTAARDQIKPHPDLITRQIIERLWMSAENDSYLINQVNNNQRMAL